MKIMQGSKNIKCAWLKSFCDDEATIKGCQIRVDTVNGRGMRQVKLLLDSPNIKNRLKHYPSRCRVIVDDIQRFALLVGFDHNLKRDKINEILSK